MYSSTDDLIAFPLNSDQKFSRTFYFPAMTQGRASSEDIDRALNLFEIVFSRANISTGDLTLSLFWRFLVPFVLLRICSSVFYGWDDDAVTVFFMIYCVIGFYRLIYDSIQQVKRLRTECELIIKTIQPGYLKRGLRWRFPEDSMSRVELIKEYCNNGRLSDPAGKSGSDNVVKPQYKPAQIVNVEVKTAVSYPPIYTVGLPSK